MYKFGYALVNNLFIWKKVKTVVPGINKIVGIYHADGGLIGELKYMTGKFFGGSHCSLCDITHGNKEKKQTWKNCERKLRMPIDFIHLNERNPNLKEYTKGLTPCIVGKTSTNYVMLVTKRELSECKGDPETLANLIENKIAN